MKHFIAVTLAVAALLALTGSTTAFADTISVYDYIQPGNFTLVHDGDEILAPILHGLSHAGFSYIAQGKTLALKTPAGREITLVMGESKAQVDGQEIPLQTAPRYVDQRCYLPVRSLAEALGMAAVWSESNKTLNLTPRLSLLKVEDSGETLKLMLGAQVRLNYVVSKLVEPPRIVVDISNLVLAEGSQQLTVNAGVLLEVRVAAQEPGKPGLRVVMDLSQMAEEKLTISQEGCLLQIEIPKKPANLPPPAAVLNAISFQRPSPQVASIVLSLSAPATVDSEMRKDKTLVIRINGAASHLETAPKIPEDALVAGLELHSLGPNGEVQEIVVKLKKETHHLLSAEGKDVRVLLGDFSLQGVKIVVDPGHGGCMTGAPGPNGLIEKDVNLAIGLKLAELLKQAGVKVYLTRKEDCELSPIPKDKNGITDQTAYKAELSMRPGLANAVKADIFVSLHCNANDANNPHPRSGSEVYYHPASPQSRPLARSILHALVNSLQRNSGGVRTADFRVLREAKMLAVLVEVAYISDKEEEKLLATDEFRARAAKGIFDGVSLFVASGGLAKTAAVEEKSSEVAPKP